LVTFGHAFGRPRGRLSRDGPWCKTEKEANDASCLSCILVSGRCREPTTATCLRAKINYSVDQVYLGAEQTFQNPLPSRLPAEAWNRR